MIVQQHINLRDDRHSALRSLSLQERKFIRHASHNGLRTDGRSPTDIRSLRLDLSRAHGTANAVLQLGNTKVLAVVTSDLVPPNPDFPNRGMMNFFVDLSPMASLAFEPFPAPASDIKLQATRLRRLLERLLLGHSNNRDGSALDLEALCVTSGLFVWKLDVHVTAIDDCGNLSDAAVLATMAALRHFRKPEVDASVASNVVILHSDDKEATPLPLHHTPVCVSFALFRPKDAADNNNNNSKDVVAAILDPSDREELVMDGSITFALNRHAELCVLEYIGGTELKVSQMIQCSKLAEKKGLQLCEMLENALKAADDKATKERLAHLKRMGNIASKVVVQSFEDETNKQVDTAISAEEEKYRMEALDYDQGHVAAKVKDDKQKDKKVKKNDQASKLIEAMIQAAHNNSINRSEKVEKFNQMDFDEVESETRNKVIVEKLAIENSKKSIYSSIHKSEHIGNIEPLKETTSSIKEIKSTQSTPLPMDGNIDSDEEEVTVLNTEFSTSEKDPNVVEIQEKVSKMEVNKLDKSGDSEVDDLIMAIKKKSKKSKKKKNKA